MKNVTKVTGLILTSAMVISLAGCGSNDNDASSASSSNTETESTSESTLSGSVSLGGSTSMESVIGYLKEQFTLDNSDVSISYAGVGSGGGIEGVGNGTYDIGLSSRDLKDEEKENGLTATTVAMDGIVVIVSADCPVDDLSLSQISQIYGGEITNWSEVGGDDLEISLIGREESSGTRDGFESITETDGTYLDQELTSTGAVITAVGSNANAIGYASLSAVEGQSDVKALTVDSITCNEDTILDGSYAISRPFVFVTADDTTLSQAAQAFFDFCLSDDAKDLIREAGAVPLD